MLGFCSLWVCSTHSSWPLPNECKLTVLTAASTQAQGPPGGGGYNPYSNGGDSSSSSNPYSSNGGFGGEGFPFAGINKMIAAHAICATIAFGLLFPTGGVMIRLFSFRGLWLVHGIFQIVALLFFAAAVAMGIYMVKNSPERLELMHEAHPIIGITLFALLLIQPILGFIHHFAFKKYKMRTFWSYAHLWLGRLAITAGIVNGGLGLKLSKEIGMFAPSKGAVIGYGAAAGAIWLLYVLSAIYGEHKRKNANYAAVSQQAPPYKYKSGSDQSVQYA